MRGIRQARETEVLTVDHRVLLLGLDGLYRDAMKAFEASVLLSCAQRLTKELGVQALDVPVEGYYTESPQLTEYFKLMRSLQGVEEEKESRVKHLPEFQLLWRITNSPMYGRPQRWGKLLPVGRDPLSEALWSVDPSDWNPVTLVEAAYNAAMEYDDYSLVGLAARIKDALVIAALRESVVLYAEPTPVGIFIEPEYEYEWRVGPELERAANRFIEAFNGFVPGALPKAEPGNAERFYRAYGKQYIVGRCVYLGSETTAGPYYHWAIRLETTGQLVLDDFWNGELWTTERYRQQRAASRH